MSADTQTHTYTHTYVDIHFHTQGIDRHTKAILDMKWVRIGRGVGGAIGA